MRRCICGLLSFFSGLCCRSEDGRETAKNWLMPSGRGLRQLDLTGEIVWVGLRDAAGKETASTQAIEEYILSGLVRMGVSFSVPESVPKRCGQMA